MKSRIAAIALLLLAGAAAHAQDLPDKPLPTVRVKLIDEATNRSVTFTLPVKRRTADFRWLALTALSAALTAADSALTVSALADPRAREANPILGARPSRVRIGVTFGALWGLATAVSWRAKREQDAAREFGARVSGPRWWMPAALNAGMHGVGVGIDAAQTGGRR